MGKYNGLMIGIDIMKYDVQVSCLSSNGAEPETLSTQVGVDKYEIPLCLFLEHESEEWYYGDAAREAARQKDGIYVDDLWEGMQMNRKLVMEEENYSYEHLFGIFLEKLMLLVSAAGYTEKNKTLIFTTDGMDSEKIGHLREALKTLSVAEENVYFVDYKESFGAYSVNAKKELWNHEVFLFYYTERSLKAFQLHVNQKTIPCRMSIGEIQFDELEYNREELEASQGAREEMDIRFAQTAEAVFGRKIISTVYLIGEGFLADWMKQSLRTLCRGRRVFQGNNLFSKGACYAAGRYLMGKQEISYESPQMMNANIRFAVNRTGGEKEYFYLLREGELWYKASKKTECMIELLPEKEEHAIYQIPVEISTISTDGERSDRMEFIRLEEFPKRPEKASRIRIEIELSDEHTGRIVVRDLGLGEFYPSTQKEWVKEFKLDSESAEPKEEAGVTTRLVQCQEQKANLPYDIEAIGRQIYTIEELGYFLCNYVHLLDEEVLGMKLVSWLRTELAVEELAKQLETAVKAKEDAQQRAAVVLKGMQFLSEKEYEAFMESLKAMRHMTDFQRKKRKADDLVRNKMYYKALQDYRGLLKEPEAQSDETASKLYHNMGVAYSKMFCFKQAGECFLKAFLMVPGKESMRQYKLAVRLCEDEIQEDELVEQFPGSDTMNMQVYEEMQSAVEKGSTKIREMKQLQSLKDEGKIAKYYQKLEEILQKWREECREYMDIQ